MISVDRFTQSAQEVAQRAAEIMQRYSHNQMDTEHVLLALIEQPQDVVSKVLEILKVDRKALSDGLDNILRAGSKGDIIDVGAGQISITPRVVQILTLADQESNRLNDEHISTEHIFLEILSEHNTPAARLLEGAGLTRAHVHDAIQQMRG